jgi:hypothetical protein
MATAYVDDVGRDIREPTTWAVCITFSIGGRHDG